MIIWVWRHSGIVHRNVSFDNQTWLSEIRSPHPQCSWLARGFLVTSTSCWWSPHVLLVQCSILRLLSPAFHQQKIEEWNPHQFLCVWHPPCVPLRIKRYIDPLDGWPSPNIFSNFWLKLKLIKIIYLIVTNKNAIQSLFFVLYRIESPWRPALASQSLDSWQSTRTRASGRSFFISRTLFATNQLATLLLLQAQKPSVLGRKTENGFHGCERTWSSKPI